MDPESVVRQLYALTSGAADQPLDRDSIAALFTTDGIVRIGVRFPGKPDESVRWTVADYLDTMEEYRKLRVDGGLAPGLWEIPIRVTTSQFGNIAHVWSIYEARIGTADAAPIRRGIKSFHLMGSQGTWFICEILQHAEVPGTTIPESDLAE